jgi:hypothetical protein
MPFSLDSLAAAATIIGTIISCVAILQTNQIIPLIGGSALTAGLALMWLAIRARRAVQADLVSIEGYSIDSLSAANLRRVVNRTVRVQEAIHSARIEDRDLVIHWIYSGNCTAVSETAFVFSIHSQVVADLESLGCIGYDLRTDPQMKHPIMPVPLGTIGLARRLKIPFLRPLRRGDPFHIRIEFRLPACIIPGFNTFTSTLSFAQDRVPSCKVCLQFTGQKPDWVRVYEVAAPGSRLVKGLHGTEDKSGAYECTDMMENIPGRSTRIYAFSVPLAPTRVNY